MTEKTQERIDRSEGENVEGRCPAGAQSGDPCWREATTIYEGRPYCEEHARLFELGDVAEGLFYALAAVETWYRGPVENDRHGHLDRLALNMRDAARQEYAQAFARADAAEFVVQHGPPEAGEPHLTPEQREELTRLIVHADSLNNARTIIEDAPDELIGTRGDRDGDWERDRWVMVAALATAADAANEEVRRFKRDLG